MLGPVLCRGALPDAEGTECGGDGMSRWGRDVVIGTGCRGVSRQRHARQRLAREPRADCVPYFAGSLQNRLERERGQGLRRVLRQEVGVSGARSCTGSAAAARAGGGFTAGCLSTLLEARVGSGGGKAAKNWCKGRDEDQTPTLTSPVSGSANHRG